MRPPQLIMTALLTALIPITAAATNLLVLRGFGLPVPAIAAPVLLIVLQVGTAVVSVPGNIGVFHYLTVVTLEGVEEAEVVVTFPGDASSVQDAATREARRQLLLKRLREHSFNLGGAPYPTRDELYDRGR